MKVNWEIVMVAAVIIGALILVLTQTGAKEVLEFCGVEWCYPVIDGLMSQPDWCYC